MNLTLAMGPARRSHQSILKEINPDYSLEGVMLKLKLQYFGHLMWGNYSLEKTLMLEKIEGRGRRGWQRTRCLMASPTQCQQFWANPGRQWRTEEPGVLWSMGSQRVGHNLASEQQCDLTKALKFHPPAGTFSLSYWNEQTRAWASPLVLEYGWKV